MKIVLSDKYINHHIKKEMDLNIFKEKCLTSIYSNNLKEIMALYTIIFNYKLSRRNKYCYSFKNLYKEIIEILLKQIIIKYDLNPNIEKRNIQLQLHRYCQYKKNLDKIFYNFRYCSCYNCLKLGHLNDIHDNMFKNKFINTTPQYLDYKKKNIVEYIENCYNSLIIKDKINLFEDKEFMKRNIFCFF